MAQTNETTMKMNVIKIALGAAVVLLAGCGAFGGGNSDFSLAEEVRPLEIPPDLDIPVTDSGMAVPGGRAAQRPAGTPASVASGDAQIRYDGQQPYLVVGDGAEGTWRRVGLALERAEIGIEDRDRAAGQYLIDFEDVEAKANKPGFFGRVFLFKRGPEDHSGLYQVLVAKMENGQSRITVLDEDGNEAERSVTEKVLSALRQRLEVT